MVPVRGHHLSLTIDTLRYKCHRLSKRSSFGSGGRWRCLRVLFGQFQSLAVLYLSKDYFENKIKYSCQLHYLNRQKNVRVLFRPDKISIIHEKHSDIILS